MKAHNPYWQFDLSLGDGVFSNGPRSIRMLLHVATGYYSLGTREIVPLAHPAGVRTSVHARPYIRRTSGWLSIPEGPMSREISLIWEIPDKPMHRIERGVLVPLDKSRRLNYIQQSLA